MKHHNAIVIHDCIAPTKADGNIQSIATKEPEKDRSGKKAFPVENYINLEMNSPADEDRVDNDYETLSIDKQLH